MTLCRRRRACAACQQYREIVGLSDRGVVSQLIFALSHDVPHLCSVIYNKVMHVVLHPRALKRAGILDRGSLHY